MQSMRFAHPVEGAALEVKGLAAAAGALLACVLMSTTYESS